MRIWLAGLALVFAIGCGNESAFTGAETPTPTPTPTGSPTATPTPGPSEIYALLASPTSQYCGIAYSNTWNTQFVTIHVDGATFTPDWGHANQPTTVSVLVAPNGTLNGDDFSANWTICVYSSFSDLTTKYVYTWTGTFTNAQANFTSTLHDTMTNASGNQLANCANVNTPMGDCSTTGLTWSVAGTRQ